MFTVAFPATDSKAPFICVTSVPTAILEIYFDVYLKPLDVTIVLIGIVLGLEPPSSGLSMAPLPPLIIVAFILLNTGILKTKFKPNKLFFS